MNSSPIGILDSGVGGLTVLSHLRDALPNESFIYYGDNGRAPYGNRSKEELTLFNTQIINFLCEKNIKMLVMACNTSCAMVLSNLKNKFNIPIIGLIDPAAKEAEINSQKKRIAIMATVQTIASHAYKKTILKINKNCDITEIACPKLVPIVENGNVFSEEGRTTALEYFQEVIDFKADTLIYGCSHYPYFKPIFTEAPSLVTNFVDPAKTVVQITTDTLKNLKSEITESIMGKTQFYVSGSPKKFTDFIDKYFYWHNINIEAHSFK